MRRKRRGRAIGGLAAITALAAATAPAQAKLTVQAFRAPNGGYPAMAPDGRLVRPVFPATVEWTDAAGHRQGIGLPDGVGYLGTRPATPLLDGALALVAQRSAGQRVVRVDPGGRATAVAVPRSSPGALWDDQAIAPDGSLWRVDLCGDVLSRTSPRGVETRFRLRRLRCRGIDAHRAWQGSELAFGPDGTAWFASLCQARVVRIPLVGRRREWRLAPRPECVVKASEDDTGQDHQRIVPTADGGLRLAHARITARGRLVRDRRIPPDAVTADGAQWRVDPAGIERRRAGEPTAFLRAPVSYGRTVIAWAAGADGRLWYLSAQRSYETSIGRVRVVGRRGRTAWVQVSCDGRLGAFCHGSVRLVSRGGRSLVRRRAAFAIPAEEGRAVPVTLTRAAARARRFTPRAVIATARG